MSDQKKCKKCGACTECGASPQIVPMPYPVYPFGQWPYPNTVRPWNQYQPYYYSTVTSGGLNATGGLSASSHNATVQGLAA